MFPIKTKQNKNKNKKKIKKQIHIMKNFTILKVNLLYSIARFFIFHVRVDILEKENVIPES